MDVGAKICETCGKPALTFATGPHFAGRVARDGSAKFFFCEHCIKKEYAAAFPLAETPCMKAGHGLECFNFAHLAARREG